MHGRKAEPIRGIELYDFDKLSKVQGTARERRRYLAFAHIQEGKTFVYTAKAVRVRLRSLMRWVAGFKAHGLDGLKDQPGRGAKRCLNLEKEKAFKLDVLELQKDRIGGRVKGRDILKLMNKKYGLQPSLATVYNILKRVNLSWITGRSIHPKADLKAQEAFKKTSKKASLSFYPLQ